MTPDWSVIGSYELKLRILSSILPTLLFVSINTCNWAFLHLCTVKVPVRVRVLMSQESCRLQERILEVTKEMVWPNPHLMRNLRHREATVLSSVSWLTDGISGAKVFCTCPITLGISDMQCVWYDSAASLDHGRDFSIKQKNQLDLVYMMTWLAINTQHHTY